MKKLVFLIILLFITKLSGNNDFEKALEMLGGEDNEYYCEVDSKYNKKDIYNMFLSLAKNNHSPSQYYLAWMYKTGCGVEKNKTEYKKLMKKSADNGYHKAELILGTLYYGFLNDQKKFVTVDQSIAYLKKASEHNNPTAMSILSTMYSYGNKVYKIEKNREKSILLLKKSFKQYQKVEDKSTIAVQIGEKYAEMNNFSKMDFWFKIAYYNDENFKSTLLGKYYYNGKAKKYLNDYDFYKNLTKYDNIWAFDWFVREIELSDTFSFKFTILARIAVSIMFLEGEGTEKNLEKAKSLINEVYHHKDTTPKQKIILSKIINDYQIEEIE